MTRESSMKCEHRKIIDTLISVGIKVHTLWDQRWLPGFFNCSFLCKYEMLQSEKHDFKSQTYQVSLPEGTRESCSMILAEARSLIMYCSLKCLNTGANGFPCSVSRKVVPSKSIKKVLIKQHSCQMCCFTKCFYGHTHRACSNANKLFSRISTALQT